jgi:hypothetical protein
MLANRAARGLASLYGQTNQFTLEQAGQFQAEWTPRGWAKAEDSLQYSSHCCICASPGSRRSAILCRIENKRSYPWQTLQVDL